MSPKRVCFPWTEFSLGSPQKYFSLKNVPGITLIITDNTKRARAIYAVFSFAADEALCF
jgi:hypothetical protein